MPDHLTTLNALSAGDDDATRSAIGERIQAHAMETVSYVPLGQYHDVAAWRTSLDGVLKAPLPLFWNVSKQP